MTDAEREYARAKAAFLRAQKRLSEAKAALPPQPSVADTKREALAAKREAMWQRYMDGVRDYGELAREFGWSQGFVGQFIRRQLREKSFGPETLQDYEFRESFWRIRAEQEAANYAMPGHSAAWFKVYRMQTQNR